MRGHHYVERTGPQLVTVVMSLIVTVVFCSQTCVGPVITDVTNTSQSADSHVQRDSNSDDNKASKTSPSDGRVRKLFGRQKDDDTDNFTDAGNFATSLSADKRVVNADARYGTHGDSEGGIEADSPDGTHGDSEGGTEADSPDGTHGNSEGRTEPNSPDGTHGDSEGGTEANSPDGTHGDSEGGTEANSPDGTHGDSEGGTEADSPDGTHGDSEGGTEADSPDGTHGDFEGGTEAKSPDGTHGDFEGGTEAKSPDGTHGDSEGGTEADSQDRAHGDFEDGTGSDFETEANGDSERGTDGDSERKTDGDSEAGTRGDSDGDSKQINDADLKEEADAYIEAEVAGETSADSESVNPSSRLAAESALSFIRKRRQVETAESPDNDRLRLELNFTSASTGFIQSPGWFYHTKYLPSINSCLPLITSEQNVIMISFVSLETEEDFDELFIYDSDSCSGDDNPISTVSGSTRPPPRVYTTHHLSFRFVSDTSAQHSGFRLLFSFHNSSAVPRQFPDGKWDCSVPFWPDFRDHFVCNYNTECAGGEDQVACDDVSPVCGVGRTCRDTVNITTEDIRVCSHSDRVLDIEAKQGVIHYTTDDETDSDTPDEIQCNIQLKLCSKCVMQFTLRKLFVSQESDFEIKISDVLESEGVLRQTQDDADSAPKSVYTFSNWVTVEFIIHRSSKDVTVEMSFTEASPSDKPHLELNYTSPSTGFIQSPGWGYQTHYLPSIHTCLPLITSEQNVIMISFVSLDTEEDFDKLFIYDSDSCSGDNNPTSTVSGSTRPPPRVYTTHHLSFRFVSDSSMQHSGFRLVFSFHNSSAVPRQLPDGKWDCSVPFWPDFRDHFVCTVDTECAGTEDKMACNDVSPVCGVELFVIGERCYSYTRPSGGHKKITWNSASDICFKKGANLASLNTQNEWMRVGSFLQSQEYGWVLVGLHLASPPVPDSYLDSWQWADETIAFYLTIRGSGKPPPYCAAFHASNSTRLSVIGCEESLTANVLCEFDTGPEWPEQAVKLPSPSMDMSLSPRHLVSCPAAHITRDFLACDVDSACWKLLHGLAAECDAKMTPLPPSFTCKNGVEQVSYSLVCDFRPDCGDSSDEELCVFPECSGVDHFKCDKQQCIKESQYCDGVKHCINEADEKRCPRLQKNYDVNMTYSRAAVDSDGHVGFTAYFISETEPCDDTHFRCSSNGYCLPVYTRCNDVYDCPGKEDEVDCKTYTCPGYYRCRKSRVCLHHDHVCDGIFHCPEHDDEWYCDVTCPNNCTCYGMAFFCDLPFNASIYPGLRFLDASGSGMTPISLVDNTMLVHVSLARCGLRQLDDIHLPNLLSLDVSDNMLTEISDVTLERLTRLQALYLSGNPLTSFFPQLASANLTFPDMKTLHVAGIVTRKLHVIVYTSFPNVQHLNLSHTRLERMPSEGFQPLKQLRDLDLRGCPMTVFSRGLFHGLDKLRTVYADNYKICCPATLPDGFNFNTCHAPSDEVSSCDSLLRAEAYRVFLSTFAIMAILGNIASFVYRMFVSKIDKLLGYDVFVTHLSLSDFLMGVYLAIIGVADSVYRGNYRWEDTNWKNSAACKAAGFVSLLSSEVSAFIICLITLDRFLVIRFPVSDFHFLRWSANVACVVAWIAGLVLAAVPLLPVTSHWQFYGQNGICLPLPITRREFPGHDYAFGVMIVLNFVLFLLIAVGQVLIYWSVTANRISVNDSVRRSRDKAIARRLFAIVMTDFLCWFPIGLLGLLASIGVPISGEANIVMVIFVLPLNSALNPFLYTFNMIMEKRRKVRDEHMRESLMAQLQSRTMEITPVDIQRHVYTQAEVWVLLHKVLKEKIVSVDQIYERFGSSTEPASSEATSVSRDEGTSVETLDFRF